MTSTPYTPEMRAADARIAVAMGYKRVQLSDLNATQYAVVPPEWINTARNQLEFGSQYGRDLYRLVPRFHADEDARRSLLEWLYRPDNTTVCLAFSRIIYKMAMESIEAGTVDSMEEFCFLATPEQVARAADAAIQEGEK